MAEFTKERIIGELKASTQNASGMFEISEDTICALMSILTSAAPQLPQPAVLSVSEGVLKSLLPDVEKSEFWFEHNGKIFFEGVRFNNAVFEACRAAMLQAEPVSQPYTLPPLDHLDTVKFNADCAIQDPDSIYANEFFLSLDEVFGERGNYSEPVQAKAVSMLIAEVFRLRGYSRAAPQQEVKSAFEHGMQRYAGAMQKLSEGDK